MADNPDGRVAKLEQAHRDLEDAMEEQEYRRQQKKRDEILDDRIAQLFSGSNTWMPR
jgi:hypothetical protein